MGDHDWSLSENKILVTIRSAMETRKTNTNDENRGQSGSLWVLVSVSPNGPAQSYSDIACRRVVGLDSTRFKLQQTIESRKGHESTLKEGQRTETGCIPDWLLVQKLIADVNENLATIRQ